MLTPAASERCATMFDRAMVARTSVRRTQSRRIDGVARLRRQRARLEGCSENEEAGEHERRGSVDFAIDPFGP